MQQIILKSEFSVLFDTVKSKKVQYLEEKIQPVKNIVTKEIQKKSLKI